MTQESGDFMTIVSISTFAGATMATWVLTAVVGKIRKKDSPWIPFVFAIVVSFIVAEHSNMLSSAIEWLLAVVNASLLFFAASGLNEAAVAGATREPAGETNVQGVKPLPWLRSWFR